MMLMSSVHTFFLCFFFSVRCRYRRCYDRPVVTSLFTQFPFLLLLLLLLSLFTFTTTRANSSYEEVQNFGANPGAMRMRWHRSTICPSATRARCAVVVILPYCSESSVSASALSGVVAIEEQSGGFHLLYPTTTTTSSSSSSSCLDVSSAATLRHDGGSHSLSIVNMVRYLVNNSSVAATIDSTQVFVIGTDEGAMMVNVLMGAYPDVFHAGVSMSGAAYGCVAATTTESGGGAWIDSCEVMLTTLPSTTWVTNALAYSQFSNYTGTYGRMMIWTDVNDNKPSSSSSSSSSRYGEQVKQWTALNGVSEIAASILPGSDLTNDVNTTRYRYGSADEMCRVEAYRSLDSVHPLTAQIIVHFLGLDGSVHGNRTTVKRE